MPADDLVYDFSSESDAPTPDDLPLPPDDQLELTDEELRAILGDPEDATPEGGQLDLISGGAALISRANGDSGVPVDRTGEDIGGTTVIIRPLGDPTDDKPLHPIYSWTIDGQNDKITREVMTKYAPVFQDRSLTAEKRNRLTISAMAEIHRRKQQAAATLLAPVLTAAKSPPTLTSGGAMPDDSPGPIPRKPIQVLFDHGPPYGRQVAQYVDAVIHGNLLILVGDPSQSTVNVPTPLDPPRPILVGIPGLEAPIRVYATGEGYPYDGKLHCLFTIERADDPV